MKALEKIHIAAIAACICIAPVIVTATSYFPDELAGNADRTQTVMKAEATVHLFHSGAGAVKNAVEITDILTVYREDPCRTIKEIGKIRIVSFDGDNFLRAVVIEGEIRPGDTAKIGQISYLITPPAFICK
jgi:hypothetical protein